MHFYGGHGFGIGHGFGMGGFAPMFFMLIFWVLVIVAGIYAIRALNRGTTQTTTIPAQTSEIRALEILQERYAKGEIDTAEFEERRRTLKGIPASTPTS